MKKLTLRAISPLLYFLSLLLAVCALFKPTALFASATSLSSPAYACILSDNTYFYESETDRSGLFILPKTYFVKVLESQTDYTKVEYLADGSNTRKIVGYCKTSELTFVDYTPKTPYLYSLFNVTYSIDGVKGAPFLTEITLSCAYYGNYMIGSETYCYVLQGDHFGYVPLPENFSFPRNEEYYENLLDDEPSEPTNGKPEEKSSSPAQTAILVLLCVLIPVLAALIVRSPRRPSSYESED